MIEQRHRPDHCNAPLSLNGVEFVSLGRHISCNIFIRSLLSSHWQALQKEMRFHQIMTFQRDGVTIWTNDRYKERVPRLNIVPLQ